MFWPQLFSGPREFELNLPSLAKNPSTPFLLLDIEGTTTPVEFVYKTLFPFASARAESFLRAHFGETEIQAMIASLRSAHGPANWNGQTPEEEIASAARFVRQLIEEDRKVTPLKALQGLIWEEGYRTGELHGEVYEDVPRAFAQWRNEGKRIAIFSSGSVLAQRLLFAHSSEGDLTKFVEAYFDTTTGPKREAASYAAIANALGAETSRIYFVSDVTAELDAASDAGMQTALMVRPGAMHPANAKHTWFENFDQILFEENRKE